MAMIGKPDRGTVEMNSEECKGCGLCVEACPPKVLRLAEGLNRYGYHPAEYRGRAAPAAASASSSVRSRAESACCGWPRRPRREAMQKQLTKGNEAIVKAAVLAGCRAFYGYPITPASEIAEAAALYLPHAGGVFVQAESEVAAINMLYGGAAAGVRGMTASSGPGISLMQEGFSYLAGAELPCVVADIMRGGPGPGQHRARAGRLQPDGQGRRPRQLPHPGAGAGFRAGDGRPDRRWPSTWPTSTAIRWWCWPTATSAR